MHLCSSMKYISVHSTKLNINREKINPNVTITKLYDCYYFAYSTLNKVKNFD